MAVAIAAHGSYVPSKFLNPPLTITSRNAPPLPLYISTDSSHVNPRHLHELFALCNHSCHRFPNFDSHGRVQPVDIGKLQTALDHSSVVVSVFTKPEFISNFPSGAEPEPRSAGIGGEWIQRVIMPVTPENGLLVGFGRAVSDLGLTASIHDVMVGDFNYSVFPFDLQYMLLIWLRFSAFQVIPGLRRRGIGRRIVQKILRRLTSMEIYDISALCNEQERLFFAACGFGDDILNSTTMMHTVTSS